MVTAFSTHFCFLFIYIENLTDFTLIELSKFWGPFLSDNVKHFGKGQTQTTIPLEPGQHTLQLLLGNFLHIPHDKPVLSEKITIEVK